MKRSNGIKAKVLFLLVLIFAAAIAGSGLYWRHQAKSIGEAVGAGTGTVVGRLAGSLDGITNGTEDGKKAAISTEDTETVVREQMEQTEKLEVLAAGVQLSNFHKIGDDDSPKYAALYLINATVVFTVDLSQAEVTLREDDNTLHVCLPRPECSLYIDGAVEKAAEYQKTRFTASAEDGFDAYLNSVKQLQNATEENLSNYDQLTESARAAAENQVQMLVSAVSIGDYTPVIEWAE